MRAIFGNVADDRVGFFALRTTCRFLRTVSTLLWICNRCFMIPNDCRAEILNTEIAFVSPGMRVPLAARRRSAKNRSPRRRSARNRARTPASEEAQKLSSNMMFPTTLNSLPEENPALPGENPNVQDTPGGFITATPPVGWGGGYSKHTVAGIQGGRENSEGSVL